jgi:hypothetical protein
MMDDTILNCTKPTGNKPKPIFLFKVIQGCDYDGSGFIRDMEDAEELANALIADPNNISGTLPKIYGARY